MKPPASFAGPRPTRQAADAWRASSSSAGKNPDPWTLRHRLSKPLSIPRFTQEYLSTLRTIILNFESSFKKAESKAIYREDAKIARKSINLSFLKKVLPSGLLASLAPSRFMQLKFWSEACLVKNNIAVLI